MGLYKFFMFAVVCVMAISCRSVQTVSQNNDDTYSTTYLSGNVGSTVKLRVWATGMIEQQLLEEAGRKAIYEILFYGIHSSEEKESIVPIIQTPDAQYKRAAFFDAFFSKQGEYKKYIKKIKIRKRMKGTLQGDKIATQGVDVTVDVEGLRKAMIQ